MISEPAETLITTRLPKRADNLEINTIEGGFMVYQPDRNRVHYLNHTAVLVLELCNGRDSAEKIAGLVQEAYGLSDAPETEVLDIIARMEDEALITIY
ncbi:MAG: PqqD family protein [Gammaproteobacteria bacterium]